MWKAPGVDSLTDFGAGSRLILLNLCAVFPPLKLTAKAPENRVRCVFCDSYPCNSRLEKEITIRNHHF